MVTDQIAEGPLATALRFLHTEKYQDRVVNFQKIMFFYVYALLSKRTKKIYIGSTGDLVRRVKEHNLGINSSTKAYVPWRLIYYEACLNEQDAKRREYYLKTSRGGRLLRRRLKDYLFQISRFA
jgi:putative endonuclease